MFYGHAYESARTPPEDDTARFKHANRAHDTARPNRLNHRATDPRSCMIGILRPQPPPNKKSEGIWLARGRADKSLDSASRRYLAGHEGLGARQPSLSEGLQRDGPPALSPTVLDGKCDASIISRCGMRACRGGCIKDCDPPPPQQYSYPVLDARIFRTHTAHTVSGMIPEHTYWYRTTYVSCHISS